MPKHTKAKPTDSRLECMRLFPLLCIQSKTKMLRRCFFGFSEGPKTTPLTQTQHMSINHGVANYILLSVAPG